MKYAVADINLLLRIHVLYVRVCLWHLCLISLYIFFLYIKYIDIYTDCYLMIV